MKGLMVTGFNVVDQEGGTVGREAGDGVEGENAGDNSKHDGEEESFWEMEVQLRLDDHLHQNQKIPHRYHPSLIHLDLPTLRLQEN